jgi:hypothetical protein
MLRHQGKRVAFGTVLATIRTRTGPKASAGGDNLRELFSTETRYERALEGHEEGLMQRSSTEPGSAS